MRLSITSAGPRSLSSRASSSICPAGMPVASAAASSDTDAGDALGQRVFGTGANGQPPVRQRRRARFHRFGLDQAELSRRANTAAGCPSRRAAELPGSARSLPRPGSPPPRARAARCRRRSGPRPWPAGRSTRRCVPAAGRAPRRARWRPAVPRLRPPRRPLPLRALPQARRGDTAGDGPVDAERAQAAASSGQRNGWSPTQRARTAHPASHSAQLVSFARISPRAGTRNARPVFRPQGSVRDQAPRSRRKQRARRGAAGELKQISACRHLWQSRQLCSSLLSRWQSTQSSIVIGRPWPPQISRE